MRNPEKGNAIAAVVILLLLPIVLVASVLVYANHKQPAETKETIKTR